MKRVRLLRAAGLWEGASYVALLFIAMPLKYAFEQPLAVRVVGMFHGMLFIFLMYNLLVTTLSRRWPLKRAFAVVGASLIPFGPWFVEKMLQREIRAEETPAP